MHHNQRFMLGLMFMLGVFLLLPSVSALIGFDTLKEYDSINEKITFSNQFLFIKTSDIATAQLKVERNNLVPIGKEIKVTEIEFDNVEEYKNAWQGFEMYDNKRGGLRVYRDYKLKFKEIVPTTIQDYKEVCNNEIKTNDSNSFACSREKAGEHIENFIVWNDLNSFDFPKGKITIGIFTEVRQGDSIEYVPVLYNARATEWAVWTADDNVGLMHYWQANETSGNIANQINSQFNVTYTGLYKNGIIGNGMGFVGGNTNKASLPNGNGTNLLPNGDYSVCWWANISTLLADRGVITFDLGEKWILKLGGNYYRLNADDVGWINFNAHTIVANQWEFNCILLQESNNNISWYVNGVIAQSLITNENAVGVAYNSFGHMDAGDMNGTLDEVSIYRRLLTPTEILNRYDGGLGITWNSGAPPDNPPVVTPIAPATNYISSNPILTLNCSITDDIAIKNATLVVNGIINATFTGNGTTNLTYLSTTASFPSGNYTWNCTAYDYLNQSTTGATRTFIIDSVAPVINILSGAQQYVANPLQNISINFSITEVGTLDSCWWWRGGNTTHNPIDCAKNFTLIYPANNPSTDTIWIEANDTAGNIGYASSIGLLKDTQQPQVWFDAPNSSYIVQNPNENISLNWRMIDRINAFDFVTEGNLTDCWRTSSVNATPTFMNCSKQNSSMFYPAGNPSPFTITIWGNDSFGNQNSESVIINKDATAPVVTILAPTSSYVVLNPGENISLNYSAIDTNVNDCFYNSTYNATLTQLNCSANSSMFYPASNPTTLTIYVYANDSLGNIGAYANVTISKDLTSPTYVVNAPLVNYTTGVLPINVTLNISWSNSNLQNCSANTTSNATLVTYPCNTNQIFSFDVGGYHSIYAYANDSFGNSNETQINFYVYYVQSSANATATIVEGGFSSHWLYINMTNITKFNVLAWLVWNNTNYGLGTQTNYSSNNSMRFDKTIVVPSINTTSVNWTWYFNISGNPSVSNWNVSGTQTLININISECGAGTYVVLNYTLYNEKTKVISDGTNATIEVDLTLTSNANSSMAWTFSGKKSDSANYLICLPNSTLVGASYTLDSIAKYDYGAPVSPHVVEYNYIVNLNLTSSSIPQTIKLYDLLSSESTSFLITYQDENYLYVQDAIVDIWRYYVSDSNFISVEHGKTDVGGQTRAHLVTEDIIYKALVWKNGVLLYTSPEFLALCQATPCQINLRASQSANNSLSQYDGMTYSYTENKTSRKVTFLFASSTGATSTMNMTIVRADAYENDTINSTQVISSGGTLTLSIPQTLSNETYYVTITKDGQVFGTSSFSLKRSSMELFGETGIILTAMAFIMLALMGISSGIATIVLGIIGLAFMGAVQIFESGSIFGVGSAILWLIVAGSIIIWKINQKRIS